MPPSPAARFGEFARPYRRTYLAGFLLLVLTNGLALLIPWFSRDAVHAIERRESLASVARYALLIAAVAVAQAFVRTASRRTILGASRRIVCDVRRRFFEQLLRLDAVFYGRYHTGDIMSRGVNDLRLLRSFYGPGVMNLANTVIVYLAVLTLLFRIDIELALLSLAVYPALFLAVNRLSRLVYARSLAVQEQLASISSRVQENLSGIQQVKLYAQEQREQSAFERACDELRGKALSMATLRGLMLALIGIASGLGTLLVLFVGGRHVIDGTMTFGDFVAFNGYLGLLVWPTIAFGWIVNVFQRGAGAMQRVAEILDETPRIPPPAGPPRERATGDIEIRGLTFAYAEQGSARPAIEDVSLSIPRGSRVAIVGPVGSGKSTLLRLLARVHAAPAGTILIGGRDVAEMPTEAVRAAIGYVPQEPLLFSTSLRENVLLGRPEAGEAEIRRAVATARLEADVEWMPRGLDTVVGERGVTLSGGQRQRASLARALLREPEILLLDDPFSAVDADTERAILEELAGTGRERTMVLVTHRPSAVSMADRVVVLDRGRVVEQGRPEELIARGGAFARFVRRHRLMTRLDES